MNNLHPTIQAAIEGHLRSPRTARQIAVEDAITKFRPDHEEACELIDALDVAIERRFGPHRHTLQEGFDLLRDMLEAAGKRENAAINAATQGEGEL